ncbi:MAG: hypothetical protein KBD64_01590 [Gammaproteobacteria bacterium]|nr:hypothetical protein [Gammaproteobacteria bacterium]
MAANIIPILELSGSYSHMGECFGASYRTEIKELAQSRMDRLISFVKKYGKVTVTQEEVLDLTRNTLLVHEKYDANIWDEFTGIARGADILLEWLLVLNSYTDLRDYICKVKGFNDPEVRFDGCTGFILDKTMTAEKQIIIGQTWDMSVEAIDYLVIVKKTPNPGCGPSMVYLTTMGCLALIGLNQHKLAVGTTNLIANDSQIGINYLHTITKALMCEDYSSLVKTIIHTTRMSGHSFLCANTTQGNLIETSAKEYFNQKLDHYPLVKTNHYGDSMLACQAVSPELRQRNSMYRSGRAISLLSSRNNWTPDALWNEVLADCTRSSSGAAICNEDYTGKFSEFATLATVLLLPELNTMWVCRGGASSGGKQKVILTY